MILKKNDTYIYMYTNYVNTLSDIDKVENENGETVVDDKYVPDLWVMILTAQWTMAYISCTLQTVTLMPKKVLEGMSGMDN